MLRNRKQQQMWAGKGSRVQLTLSKVQLTLSSRLLAALSAHQPWRAAPAAIRTPTPPADAELGGGVAPRHQAQTVNSGVLH